jgi:hypothetical protein
MAWKLPTEKRL